MVFEDGRATGVEAKGPTGKVSYRARREIIISAGTILSPKLLMQSGIGDAHHLRAMGIKVRHANPHVGAHLLDHAGVSIPHRVAGARGLNDQLRGVGLARSVLRYLLFGEGILAAAGEIGAFLRAHPDATRPDAQLMLLTFSQSPPRPGRFMGDIEREPGFVAMGCVLNATSEGTVTLASPDPFANPRIQPNAFSTDHDRVTAVEIVKAIRRLVSQPAVAGLVKGEAQPWRDAHSDDEILDVVLKRGRNFNHAVGTCRMGREGEAVVDERLRVWGVSGLRVADCSVMPTLPSGNTNGPAQMVGWRVSELILEDRDKASPVRAAAMAG